MAFQSLNGNLAGGQTDGAQASGLHEIQQGEEVTASVFNADLRDLLAADKWQELPGVLVTAGNLTSAALAVSIPAGFTFAAGGQVWQASGTTSVNVADAATTYLWGCADGQVRSTATTAVPTGWDARSCCLLVKATATGGVATLDLSVQQKARFADATNRKIVDGPLTLDYANGAALLSGVLMGNASALRFKRRGVSYGSDANKTLLSSEYDGTIIDIGAGTALTATRQLVFPLTDGAIWLVCNNSTGGQSILCIGATGTGVTIATGKSAWVFGDGVNIRRATADV